MAAERRRKASAEPATGQRPLRLEYLSVEQLNDNPKNWRLHPPEQMAALESMMDDVGWAGALLYNEQTQRLLDGHGRKALFLRKGGEVPVLIGSWDEETERKILATFDSLGDLAEPDQNQLLDLRELVMAAGSSASQSVLAALDAATLPKLEHQVITVPTVSLKPHPKNYKDHPPEQIEHLIKSIEEHGAYRPIIVARDNTILAGHGLCMAYVRMGQTRAQVIRLPLDADDPRALKLVVADNEIGALAGRDDRRLTEMLKELDTTLGDLLGTGFDDMKLANLLHVTRSRDELPDFDAAAEWVGMPEYEREAAPIRLIIAFPTEDDRAKFCAQAGVRPIKKEDTRKVWSARWPDVPRHDLSSLKWVGEPAV